MIVRYYRALVHPGKEREFEQLCRQMARDLPAKEPGCTAFLTGRSQRPEGVEFAIITHWVSLDALKRATGQQWQKPVVMPEEAPLIARSELEHYEVLRP